MLGAHVDSPQELPLLFTEDAVNLPHGREVQLICSNEEADKSVADQKRNIW